MLNIYAHQTENINQIQAQNKFAIKAAFVSEL